MTTYGSSSLSKDRICCGMRSYSSSLMRGYCCAPATLVFKNGEATVNAGESNTLPRSGNTWLGICSRVALMFETIRYNCGEAGSTNKLVRPDGPFEIRGRPLNTADRAAMVV